MRRFKVNERILRLVLGAGLIAVLAQPAPVRALTLPVVAVPCCPNAAVDDSNDEPRVWRLLNPVGAFTDAGAPSWGGSVTRFGDNSHEPSSGIVAVETDSAPTDPIDPRDPRPDPPADDFQPSSSGGCGAPRLSGGLGANLAGLFAVAPGLEPAAVVRLPAAQTLFDLPKHAGSVFRPPRPRTNALCLRQRASSEKRIR
jgi:hypothetical protein